MIIKNAQFVISVADKNKVLVNAMPEIAVAGKSNVGKSSFINFITNNGKLAKTSKEPGRTRLINYFVCNKDEFMLVDLPGYGFARVSEGEKQKWGALIEGYLLTSPTLRNVFLLVDIRRDPNEDDIMMINYLHHYAISLTIVATKADKLSKTACLERKRVISRAFSVGVDNIIVTSSLTKIGMAEIDARIAQVIAPQEAVEEEAHEDA